MSHWKQAATLRREARTLPAPDPVKAAPAKKDRRRWCGGHVGRRHAWEEGPSHHFREDHGIMEVRCRGCGKVHSTRYPADAFPWMRYRGLPGDPLPD